MGLAAELVVSAVSIAGGLISLAIAYVGWQRRDHPAALPFSKMAVFTALWGILYGGSVFVEGVQAAYVTYRVTGVFGILALYYFVIFSIQYTGAGDWLTTTRRRLLFGYYGVIAVVTLSTPSSR